MIQENYSQKLLTNVIQKIIHKNHLQKLTHNNTETELTN